VLPAASVTALAVADLEFHMPTSTINRLPPVTGEEVVTAVDATLAWCVATCWTNAGGDPAACAVCVIAARPNAAKPADDNPMIAVRARVLMAARMT